MRWDSVFKALVLEEKACVKKRPDCGLVITGEHSPWTWQFEHQGVPSSTTVFLCDFSKFTFVTLLFKKLLPFKLSFNYKSNTRTCIYIIFS